MLSFHDLRGLPLRRLPSYLPVVPFSTIFGRASWRQTWPHRDDLRHLTVSLWHFDSRDYATVAGGQRSPTPDLSNLSPCSGNTRRTRMKSSPLSRSSQRETRSCTPHHHEPGLLQEPQHRQLPASRLHFDDSWYTLECDPVEIPLLRMSMSLVESQCVRRSRISRLLIIFPIYY